MKEKSEYEELNEQMYTIIREAIVRQKSNGRNLEFVYEDSKKSIKLARYVIDGYNLYYDIKTGEAYVSKEELFEKGKDEIKKGVVYLHRPYAHVIKELLPYYEITCLNPKENGYLLFYLSCHEKGSKNPKYYDKTDRYLPTFNIKQDWKSDTNLKMEDLLGAAYEATPSEKTMLREAYMNASCLLNNVGAISEDIIRKNKKTEKSHTYQGNGPKTKGDDGR